MFGGGWEGVLEGVYIFLGGRCGIVMQVFLGVRCGITNVECDASFFFVGSGAKC